MGSEYTSRQLTGEEITYLFPDLQSQGNKYKKISDFPLGNEGYTTQTDSTESIRHFMGEQFNKLSDQLGDHDKKQSEERKKLLEQLQKENQYFRRQMAAKYTPEKLRIRSLFVGILFLLFLGLALFTNIQLVHPILSTVIIITALVFHVMAILMKRERE